MAGEPSRTVAVVDMGSNSVRLLVCRRLTDSAFEVVDEERFDARIGEGQAGGDLTPEGMERGIAALRVMAGLAHSYRPERFVVAGTEALRRAPNAGVFLERARAEFGVEIRVLSGEEEARASFLGVANSTPLRSGYLLDIGGGSLEVMRVDDRSLTKAQSAPLGAIYARERYFSSDPPAPREVRSLRKSVRSTIDIPLGAGDLFGAGGAVRNLGRIVRLRRRYPLRRLHGLVITRKEVHRIAQELVRLPADGRRKMAGVGANRVDTLPAAAVVVDEVMDLLGAPTLTVAGQGLREGLAWDELRPGSPLVDDVRTASIEGVARSNGVREDVSFQTREAAGILFEAIAPREGLTGWDRELLCAAASLTGIGMHIDFYNRDRHGEYLIHSADLHGFNHREAVLLGALVRWADEGAPDLSPYRAIVAPDDGRRVTVLATILGLARAINRRRPSPLHGVRAKVKGDELVIRLDAAEDLAPETHDLQRQSRRVELNLKLQLAVRPEVTRRAPSGTGSHVLG